MVDVFVILNVCRYHWMSRAETYKIAEVPSQGSVKRFLEIGGMILRKYVVVVLIVIVATIKSLFV